MGVWNFVDSATKVLVRICVQTFCVFVVGAVIYVCISTLPRNLPIVFRILFYFFILLYSLFSIFSFLCLVTKFQSKRVLPPQQASYPNANAFYNSLWKVESFAGIDDLPLKDRYRYWSFIHYATAVVMFINATYCLSSEGWILPTDSAFNSIGPVENVLYTIDILHKGVIISETLSHFGKYISNLPHAFSEVNFESVYFLSFKIVSALLLISVLAMLFEPSFSRLAMRGSRRRGKR